MIIFLVSLSTLVNASLISSLDIAKKDIRISMINQEPDPVEPGQYLDVKFRIENYGTNPTNSIELELHENYPFTIVGDGLAVKEIAGLNRRQITSDSQIISWRLKIDKDAPEGESELVISYRELGSSGTVVYKEKFFVDVRTSDTILEVTEVSTVPEKIVPGVSTVLKLKLENLGYSFVKDVSVELDLQDTKISVLDGNSKKIIPKIDGKSIDEVSFVIIAESDSDIKVHKIPLKLNFKDNLNNLYEQDSSFGVKLESELDYLISVDSSDIKTFGETGEIDIRISNPSVANMRYLQVELVESEQYKILSSPKIYIGNVESDDFETLNYKIHVYDKNTDKDVFMRLKLNYKDDYNGNFISEEDVYLPLYSVAEMKKYGIIPEQNYFGTIFFLLIIVLIIGYFIYKKKKCKVICKRNNEKK
jgi:hypothetical protein